MELVATLLPLTHTQDKKIPVFAKRSQTSTNGSASAADDAQAVSDASAGPEAGAGAGRAAQGTE
jgi:hypothetical protein